MAWVVSLGMVATRVADMMDILERLRAQPKVNGAYLKDIEDAIKEIEDLRQMLIYCQQQSSVHFDLYQEAIDELKYFRVVMEKLDGVNQQLWSKLEGLGAE